jgi:hypothetical protein
MAATLRKLETMEGQRFYFVLSPAIERRARVEAMKAGYQLSVVYLPPTPALADRSDSGELTQGYAAGGEGNHPMTIRN